MATTTSRKIRVFSTSRGEIRLGSRQLRLLDAVGRRDVLPATTWSAWSSRAPQWSTTADVLVALKEKGLIEPTDTGLFDLFAARLLPDYRITELGREVLA